MATSTYKGEYRWEWTGATYKDDYTLLFIVGIAFSVSWFIQVFFCCMPLCMTPIESKWLVLEEQRQKALKDAIEAAKKKKIDQLEVESMPEQPQEEGAANDESSTPDGKAASLSNDES